MIKKSLTLLSIAAFTLSCCTFTVGCGGSGDISKPKKVEARDTSVLEAKGGGTESVSAD